LSVIQAAWTHRAAHSIFMNSRNRDVAYAPAGSVNVKRIPSSHGTALKSSGSGSISGRLPPLKPAAAKSESRSCSRCGNQTRVLMARRGVQTR
jgi:hypothetical protein